MKIIRQNPIFSLFFLFSLILLNGIGVTLPIPNLILLAEYYNFPMIGIVEAVFVGVSTFFLIFWGLLVDRLERKKLIWIANILWIFPSFMIFLFKLVDFIKVYLR